jgi:hypothetical protein
MIGAKSLTMAMNLSRIALCFCSLPLSALVSVQHPNYQLDLRLLARVLVDYRDYPNSPLSPTHVAHPLTGVFRLELQQAWAQSVSSHFNILISQASAQSEAGPQRDVNRSGWLYHSFNDHKDGLLAVDQLDLTFEGNHVRLRAGRQSIGLGTTFFFSPNDFFAPFAPQSFYRVYRPGVDAIRVTWFTGALSEAEWIYVLGYEADPKHPLEYRHQPSSHLDSMLVRTTGVIGPVEVNLFIAQIGADEVLGTAWQMDWAPWVGMRFEAQVRDEQNSHKRNQVSLSIDHRFETGLDIRAEWFYYGPGASRPQDYQRTLAQTEDASSYLARYYMALGASYVLTPLWTLDAALLLNLVDESQLYSLQGLVSVSDESEFQIAVRVANGNSDEHLPTIESEYGLYPLQLSLEYRIYF